MKATIEFDLNNEEDRMAHLRCVKSMDMAQALFEITRNLKHTLKQRFENNPQNRNELDEVFKEIQGYMDQFSINIEELIN